MTINELMHNDLFMCGGGLCRFVIRTMDAIVQRLSDKNEYKPCAILSAEPITLTEEILKVNGFKWTETWRAWCIFGEGNKHIMVTYDGDMFYIHGTCIKFKYVHELQHALRLCGLNELADNFKTETDK